MEGVVYNRDAGLVEALGFQCLPYGCKQGFFAGQSHWDSRPDGTSAGETVEVRRFAVDLLDQPLGHEIREPYAGCVAMGDLGEVESRQAPNGRLGRLRHALQPQAPDDVCVHARTTIVLPHLADHAEIQPLDRQGGHVVAGQIQEVLLLFRYLCGRQALDQSGLFSGILDDREAPDYRQPLQYGAAYRQDGFNHRVPPELVNHRRALRAAHTDREHLHQPAFVGTMEGGVRLDPVDYYTPSASVASRATWTGNPARGSPLSPNSTTSTEQRTGALTSSSVTPKLRSRSRCPSA